LSGPEQVSLFDRAVALFQKGSLADARVLFEQAASGPVREVAHSARVHAQICARRAGEQAPEPATADEHYNLAIALLNRRDLAMAEQHLAAAASMEPDADHILYALALAKGLRGQLREAAESLRRAIHINPRNRSQARHDPDFAPLVQEPLLAAVLRGDGEPIG
jgi:tetratricopeptide (TPR) repeat protein